MTAETAFRCLGCGNVAADLGEHRRHLSAADHPDHGEAVVGLSDAK